MKGNYQINFDNIHEWKSHLEILSLPRGIENSRQFLLLLTDILQKTAFECPSLRLFGKTSTLYVPKFCPSQSEYYFLGRQVIYWNIKYKQTDSFSPLTRSSTLLVSLHSEFSTFDPQRRNPITKVREAFHYMIYTTQNGLSDRFERNNSKDEHRD